jgi:hypothetical protein
MINQLILFDCYGSLHPLNNNYPVNEGLSLNVFQGCQPLTQHIALGHGHA